MKNLDEFYKDYFHDGHGTPYILDETMRFVPHEGAYILDIGCGTAFKSMHFRRGGANRVIGIDSSAPMIKKAKEVLDEAFIHDLNERLPFDDGTFDMIYCSNVLEHLFDYMTPLREMKRILKPGKSVLIEVPNVNYWPNRLLMLFGRNLIWIGVGKHIRAFNKNYLKVALTKAGFTDVKITGSVLPFPNTSLKVHLPYMNRLLPGLCFSLFGRGCA